MNRDEALKIALDEFEQLLNDHGNAGAESRARKAIALLRSQAWSTADPEPPTDGDRFRDVEGCTQLSFEAPIPQELSPGEWGHPPFLVVTGAVLATHPAAGAVIQKPSPMQLWQTYADGGESTWARVRHTLFAVHDAGAISHVLRLQTERAFATMQKNRGH